MIQYRWRDRQLGADTGGIEDEKHLFMGTDATRGGICVCPALNAWMGEQLHKEGLAAKEQRKGREEKALLKRGNKKE